MLVTGATGDTASQMPRRFREIYALALIDVKDTDPIGAKVQDITITDLPISI